MAPQPPSNPFYASSHPTSTAPPSNASNPSASPPPAYSRPAPPVPPRTTTPVTYSSLSDLGKGRANAPAGYSYTPDASRRGYPSDAPAQQPPPAVPPRHMPPPPSNHGVGLPREPPRRTVGTNERTETPPPGSQAKPASRFQQAQTTAAGYVPNSVSATATSLGDKVKDGFDSIATQQRREQVVSGAGKVAAGAAKMAGKAAWSLGKFASGSK